jgi:hypothetical protein
MGKARKAKFNADFVSNPLKKLQKTKKRQKNGVLDFYYCVKKFSAYNFLGELLALFSTDSNSALNFAFYDTHKNFQMTIFGLILALFAKFKVKIGQKN